MGRLLPRGQPTAWGGMMDGIAAFLVWFLGAAMAASLLNSLRQAKRIRELRSDWNQSQHKWLAYQQHVTWEMGQLKAELDTLAPYRQVRDADAEARRLREEAWHYQQSTIARANRSEERRVGQDRARAR